MTAFDTATASKHAPAASTTAGSDARVLSLPEERVLQDWKEAHERSLAYLAALGVAEPTRSRLATDAVARALSLPWETGSDAVRETLRALHVVVRETYPAAEDAAFESAEDAFLGWRLAHAGRGAPGAVERPSSPAPKGEPLRSMPLVFRRSMRSDETLERSMLKRWWQRLAGRRTADAATHRRPLRQARKQLPWTRVARRRRLLLFSLILLPTLVASNFMAEVLPYKGRTGLELAIVVFFGALFGWISIGFWTATLGFLNLVRKRDKFAITHIEPGSSDESVHGQAGRPPWPDEALAARTVVIMPICNEPVERVFSGLRAIYDSLARTGREREFHFFVLSDTADPTLAAHEVEAWFEWCRAVDGFGRIFYRRRKVRIERKSGNVADFLRRWGSRYEFMISLDADSLMAGETLVKLVDLAERHPDAGLIQTVPAAVNRTSLLARVQQFSSHLYGPMFAAGLHYWQLGDGQYWGHNTIIRVKPFMDHCGLPRLPGVEPLGGEILSHDFVEAALLGRAGWTLWLAYDLGGSYEEVPSTLLEEMKRDRRWCQGNLQHLRLLFTEGFFGPHRMLFLNGALSYVSALLWFTFLALSTVEAVINKIRPPEYFPHGRGLFPEWPVWRPDWALSLAAVTAVILFLPKLLSILLVIFKKRQLRQFGGFFGLSASVLTEILMSSLMAPIRMVFHSRYVVLNLLGRTVGWKSGSRDEEDTSWGEAFRHHVGDTLFASAWGAGLYWLNPGYFWWVMPIIGALMVSIPMSVWTSRTTLGTKARKLNLFVIPEEHTPPQEMVDLHRYVEVAEATKSALPELEKDGFVRAVVDPYMNALHRAVAGRRRRVKPGVRAARRRLIERALRDGPAVLSPRQRRYLMHDPEAIDELHERVWSLPDRFDAARWGRPGSHPGHA